MDWRGSCRYPGPSQLQAYQKPLLSMWVLLRWDEEEPALLLQADPGSSQAKQEQDISARQADGPSRHAAPQRDLKWMTALELGADDHILITGRDRRNKNTLLNSKPGVTTCWSPCSLSGCHLHDCMNKIVSESAITSYSSAFHQCLVVFSF